MMSLPLERTALIYAIKESENKSKTDYELLDILNKASETKNCIQCGNLLCSPFNSTGKCRKCYQKKGSHD